MADDILLRLSDQGRSLVGQLRASEVGLNHFSARVDFAGQSVLGIAKDILSLSDAFARAQDRFIAAREAGFGQIGQKPKDSADATKEKEGGFFGTLKDVFQTVFGEGISGLFNAFTFLKGIFDAFFSDGEGFFSGIIARFKATFAAVTEAFAKLGAVFTSLGPLIDSLRSVLSEVFDVFTAVKGVFGKVVDLFLGVGDVLLQVKDSVAEVFTVIADLVVGVSTDIAGAFSKAGEGLKKLASAAVLGSTAIITGILQAFGAAFTSFAQSIAAIFERLKNFDIFGAKAIADTSVGRASQAFANDFSRDGNTINGLKKLISSGLSDIGEINFAPKIASRLETAKKAISDEFTEVSESYKGLMPGLMALGDSVDVVKKEVADVSEAFAGVKEPAQGVADAIGDTKTAFAAIVDAALGSKKEQAAEQSDTSKETAKPDPMPQSVAANGVLPGATAGVPNGQELPSVFGDLKAIFDQVKNIVSLPGQIKDAISGVKDGIKTAIGTVKDTFTAVPDAVKGAFNEVTGGFKGLFKGEGGFLGGIEKLFSNEGPLAKIFSKEGPLAKLFAKDGAIGKIFSKDGPLAKIFDKDGPIGKLFSKEGPLGKLFSKEGPLGKLFGQGGPLGGVGNAVKGLFKGDGPLSGIGKVFSKEGGLLGGLFGEGGIASKAGEVFKPLTDGIGKIFKGGLDKLGGSISGALGNAFGGAQIGGLLSIFGNKGQTGAQIGGAVGSFLPIPGGSIIGATIGKLFGSIFGSTPRSSATIVTGEDGGDITNVRGKGKGRKEQAQQLAGGVIDQLRIVADALGADIKSGLNIGSIGTRKKNFVFDPTGRGRTKGSGVQKFKTEEEAIRAALRNAVSKGAVDGLSAAVQRALRSSPDLEKGLQEALKVQELEAYLKGAAAEPLVNIFLEFEQQAKARLDTAKKHGFNLVELERLNAEQRAKILEMHLEALTAPVSDLLKDITGGALAGGSPVEMLARLEEEQQRLFEAALMGDEQAIAQFAAVSRDYIALAEDVYGTAGLFNQVLSSTEQLAQQLIDQTEANLKQQQTEAQIEAGTLPDPQLSEANMSLDEMVTGIGRLINGIDGLNARWDDYYGRVGYVAPASQSVNTNARPPSSSVSTNGSYKSSYIRSQLD